MLSKRMETATKFVDHYATHDNEVLHTLLTDDLTYEFAPSRSLDNLKSLDKKGYIEFKGGMKLAMTGYPLDVNKYVEGESANSKSLDNQLPAVSTGRRISTPATYLSLFSLSPKSLSKRHLVASCMGMRRGMYADTGSSGRCLGHRQSTVAEGTQGLRGVH